MGNRIGSTVTRSDMFITSKPWNTEHRPENVRPALLATLKALRLDYLDLYLIHWPVDLMGGQGTLFPKKADGTMMYDNVDKRETWKALEACVQEGLVRHIGLSNFNLGQVRDIQASCTIQPAALQIECHPYLPQN